MLKFFNSLTSSLVINKNFQFSGSTEEIKDRLDKLMDTKWKKGYFYSKKVDEQYYQIFATISLGTVSFRGGGGSPVKIHLKINPATSAGQVVNITTKLCPENWFIMAAFIFMNIGFLVAGDAYSDIPETVGIFIVCFLWFNLIYRIQEKILIKKTAKILELWEEKTN